MAVYDRGKRADAAEARLTPKYKRIIIKFTGEIFRDGEKRLSENAAAVAAREVKSVCDLGLDIIAVLGGGNLVRGRDYAGAQFLEKATADYMGMLATVINGVLFEGVLKGHDVEVRLMNSLNTEDVAEKYIRKRALRHLEKRRVVLLVGGTGDVGFTTDAAAIKRAAELNADAVLKATKVDGIYDKDPELPGAIFLETITVNDFRQRQLNIIKETDLVMNEARLPIHVFNIFRPGNLRRLLLGEPIGSRIVF